MSYQRLRGKHLQWSQLCIRHRDLFSRQGTSKLYSTSRQSVKQWKIYVNGKTLSFLFFYGETLSFLLDCQASKFQQNPYSVTGVSVPCLPITHEKQTDNNNNKTIHYHVRKSDHYLRGGEGYVFKGFSCMVPPLGNTTLHFVRLEKNGGTIPYITTKMFTMLNLFSINTFDMLK